jgi:site-specific recombinase XerD
MPRSWPETHLTNGKVVGFKVRPSREDNIYFVFFNGPDGRRRERSTGCTTIEKARTAAREIIDREYAAPHPDAPKLVTWDEAEAKLKARMTASGLRDDTVDYYVRVLSYLKKFCTEAAGPAQVTPARAQDWADHYTTAKGRGDKVRSGHTSASVIGAVKAVYSEWFLTQMKAQKIVTTNPFTDVEPPKTDKPEIHIATDETLAEFDGWLADRFGEWNLPRLFVAVKELTGCRVRDVCSLRSEQLRDGRLHFPADLTKGRTARAVPLPEDLFAAVNAIKGPVHLWQTYPAGLKGALEKKGWPTHQLKPDFSPARMVRWIMTVFADFNAAHSDAPKLKSHQLRKRAFTASWEAGIDPRHAAIAIGCNVDTMMKHYVKLDEQAITDEVFEQLTPTLRRKPAQATDSATETRPTPPVDNGQEQNPAA